MPTRRAAGPARPKVKTGATKGAPTKASAARAPKVAPVKLLSGGNPQIAKADGDAPVQAYIDALPGWKADIVRWLDRLVVSTVPDVRKAVKWNSPFYGVDGNGWFLSVHVFTRYVKLTFFRGASLQPLPPGESASKDARHLDIRESDTRDDAQMRMWIEQAAALPGWMS